MSGGALLLFRVLTHCMELSWLCAWASFATIATMHRPFPLFEATLAFVGAFILTRLSTGKGWLVLGILGAQAAGLLCATAGILHATYFPAIPLLDRSWIPALFHAARTPVDWMTLFLNLVWAILFWGGGVALARRPVEHAVVCSRFDAGAAALLILFLVRWLAAANGGAVDDSVSHLFVYPFFVAGLVAIGMAHLGGDSERHFLPGARGVGVFLTFAAAILLFASTLSLFFLPYLTLAARAGLFVMKGTAVALSPFLLAVLRFLFAPRSLRPEPETAAHPSTLPHPVDLQQHEAWWMVLIEKILAWGVGGLLILAGIVVLAVAAFCLVRYLLSRAAGGPGRREHRSIRSAVGWLHRLWALLSGIPKRKQGAPRACDFYRALLSWARRSGHPHLPTETPSEFGARMRGRFSRLGPEIALIVHAFNRESYGAMRLDAVEIADLWTAWRRVRSPRYWPARVKQWWSR